MTIYEKNIQTLSKYYPGMDYNIDKAKHDLKENYTIIEEKSKDGMPVLKVKKDGHCCYLPTDMQPQMAVTLALSQGTSVITESIFENRFKYRRGFVRGTAR